MLFRIKKNNEHAYELYYRDEMASSWERVEVNGHIEWVSINDAMYYAALFKEQYEKKNGVIVKEFEL